MRELKFRVWNKRDKKFHTDFYTGIGITGDIIFTDDTWQPCDEDFEFQQFTGIKDKNGVEIYEGDILKWYPGWMYREIHFGKVEWINGSYYYVNDGYAYKYIKWVLRNPLDGAEVVGNIFENSELLKHE